jgi:hypothetical protein
MEMPLTPIQSKQLWDHHNIFGGTLDDDDYVYIIFGGRTASNTVEYLKILKSNYPLTDMTNFDCDFDNPAKWTYISPPEDSGATGRGYKSMGVDNYGILHVPYMTSGKVATIRERRSGTWSTPVELISLTSDGLPQLYSTHYYLGNEPGQRSFRDFWTYRKKTVQPETSIGSTLRIELNYKKTVPQGDGTYKVYRGDGVESSLPLTQTNKDCVYSGESFSARVNSTAYAVDDIYIPATPNGHCYICTSAGTSAASPPTFPTDHHESFSDGTATFEEWANHGTDWVYADAWGEIVDTDTPCCVFNKCLPTEPWGANETLFCKLTATGWTFVQIEANPSFDSRPEIIRGSNGLIVVGTKDYSGVAEYVKYTSTDVGATWSSAVRLTTSEYSNMRHKLSYRTGAVKNFMFSQTIYSRGHGEAMSEGLQVSEGAVPIIPDRGIHSAVFGGMIIR